MACDQVLIRYVLNIEMFEKKNVGEAGKWTAGSVLQQTGGIWVINYCFPVCTDGS